MGYKVTGTTISITRGDTGYFKFTPYVVNDDGSKTEYEVQAGDTIRFAMKKKLSDSYEVLLVKDVDPNTFKMKLNPEDTKNLSFGQYVYDVQLTKASGEVDTYIPSVGETATFIVEKEVDRYEQSNP